MLSERYGMLTIVGAAPSIRQKSGKPRRMVVARCECGIEKTFQLSNLRTGNTMSCGCQAQRGLRSYNAKRAEPQRWQVDGEVASIKIGDMRVLVDACDVDIVGAFRWHINHYGYAAARGGRVLLHRLILGLRAGDDRQVDHRFHDKLDNRRSEIRIATATQNIWNARSRGGSSNFKGVCFDRSRNRFQVHIQGRYLGRYRDEQDAAAAYDRAAMRIYGPFAVLNLEEAN
ncbi:hypothetical protein GG804_24915 [Sphingomonas histidinilytica]|uniref:hypothetical protein n=1 Tax=Rhizorhabdus histidinilytica TaxID=439228 RepID=UPI001ADB5F2F|nr:hypothetical protein [Rhizorhabdus histidinilytica]MBO9380013.1 hypothetical protein [Rhizorhabdus histidinilytica]